SEDSPRRIPGSAHPVDVGGRCRVMGVVNVTPDSFSDGGRFLEPDRAVAQALALAAEGAELLDVGAESTRPGALEVTVEEEWRRIHPVLASLRGRTETPISIDTRHAEVARRALAEGADLVNDVSGLRDPEMRRLLARTGAPAIVMHLRGEPATMQQDTEYPDLRGEVYGALADSVARAESDGIDPARLLIDPGLGFGKTGAQSLELLGHVGELRSLGLPVVIGVSRKSFLGAATGGAPVTDRLEAGIAASVLAATARVAYVRTHDVLPTVRALRLLEAVRHAGTAPPRATS
ncbi:MAG: dihydropteroate synthase, partial [Thermoplasmata archaeon]